MDNKLLEEELFGEANFQYVSQYLLALRWFMFCLCEFLQQTQVVPETFQNDGAQDIPCAPPLEDDDPQQAIIVML